MVALLKPSVEAVVLFNFLILSVKPVTDFYLLKSSFESLNLIAWFSSVAGTTNLSVRHSPG